MDILSPVGEARNTYSYAADGTKLQVVKKYNSHYNSAPIIGSAVNTSALDVTKTTDYVGNKIFENNALDRILVDGGYIKDGTYYFYETDHLGDNRTVVNQSGTVIERNDYYPYGMQMAHNELINSSSDNKRKFSNKELDVMHGLNLYDSQARSYDPTLGRFTTVDPLAEKYYSISPYVYCGDNPLNAVDADGRLIIFINGFNLGDGGSRDYWGKFASDVENHLHDNKSIFLDGSLGGVLGLLGRSLSAKGRSEEGYGDGVEMAPYIIAQLSKGEKIKFITHSMGGAYAKGLIKALIEYAKKHGIDPKSLIDFEADFAPFQPDRQKAVEGVRTYQFSHNNDKVAGNDPIEGAEQVDTSQDENQGHQLVDFTMKDVAKLPAGKYKVVDGKIVSQ